MPVGAPHAMSRRSPMITAKTHLPESVAIATPATDSGQNGKRNPAEASIKVIAYSKRLLCDMGCLFPHLYKPQ